jgi:hypothetical protein
MSPSTPDDSRRAGDAPQHASPASLLGKVPITLFMRDGTLALADGRLSFTTRRSTVFDRPVGEFHSFAPSASVGMHIWHGDHCYKFVPKWDAVHSINTSSSLVDVAVNAAQMPRALRNDRQMRDARAEWAEVLGPLLGTPPPGVKVTAPWPTWAVWVSIVVVTMALAAVIIGIALATA